MCLCILSYTSTFPPSSLPHPSPFLSTPSPLFLIYLHPRLPLTLLSLSLILTLTRTATSLPDQPKELDTRTEGQRLWVNQWFDKVRWWMSFQRCGFTPSFAPKPFSDNNSNNNNHHDVMMPLEYVQNEGGSSRSSSSGGGWVHGVSGGFHVVDDSQNIPNHVHSSYENVPNPYPGYPPSSSTSSSSSSSSSSMPSLKRNAHDAGL